MKKLLFIAISIAISSIAVSANDSCYRQCNSDANQIGLQCQKLRQICTKVGPSNSSQYEICMDDVAACLQTGKAIYESCNLECGKEE